MNNDIVIVGGGLAGLCSAIFLSQKGLKVKLIEKNSYPMHRVCGEYVSNEVLSFLNSLDFDPFSYGAKQIDKLLLTTIQGKAIESNLNNGGFSLSRYVLDASLANIAKKKNVSIVNDSVVNVRFQKGIFEMLTKKGITHNAHVVIGAYGKRSSLDKTLNRKFIKKSSPFLAVKAHYKCDFPDDLVALHNFEGGYCGLSKIENNLVNACYISNYKSFKRYKSFRDFQEKVMFKNPYLKEFFVNAHSVFEQPLTISQINFTNKELIKNHVLMCGDSAGLIHPLCGNGMSMAIQSAQILSKKIFDYFSGSITSREELENSYVKRWNQEFRGRLNIGKYLAEVFKSNRMSHIALFGLKLSPTVVPKIISKTHGKPIQLV